MAKDLNADNFNNVELIDSLANIIESLNKKIEDSDFQLNEYTTVINTLSTAKDLYKELKEITLYTDVLLVQELQQNVNDFLEDLNTKLESGFFKGADGNDGLSAYELAVNNGFVGSLTDWLNSLKPSLDWNELINKPSFDSDGYSFFNGFYKTGVQAVAKDYGFTDFNDIHKNSIYFVRDGELLNQPYPTFGFVHTLVHASGIHQKQIFYSAFENMVFSRHCFSGSWQAWTQII